MRRLRVGPLNSENTSNANEPKAAMIDVCGCWITLSASAKTRGMTIAARAALFSAAMSGTGRDDTRGLFAVCDFVEAAILLEAGCIRVAAIAPIVWARARDTALGFYLRHGFVVDGEGFIDEQTQKPHHFIIRRLT